MKFSGKQAILINVRVDDVDGVGCTISYAACVLSSENLSETVHAPLGPPGVLHNPKVDTVRVRAISYNQQRMIHSGFRTLRRT